MTITKSISMSMETKWPALPSQSISPVASAAISMTTDRSTLASGGISAEMASRIMSDRSRFCSKSPPISMTIRLRPSTSRVPA